MSSWFYEQVKKGIADVKSNPRKCEICGEVETIHNVMLKYDNGMIMCDDCAVAYFDNDDKCSGCKWHDDFSCVCENGDSEFCADFVTCGCSHYEKEK